MVSYTNFCIVADKLSRLVYIVLVQDNLYRVSRDKFSIYMHDHDHVYYLFIVLIVFNRLCILCFLSSMYSLVLAATTYSSINNYSLTDEPIDYINISILHRFRCPANIRSDIFA